MRNAEPAPTSPGVTISVIAVTVFILDQITKALILKFLPYEGEERILLDGFFKLVHWKNTGAAWSMFQNQNAILAVIALVALLVLFLYRHHFETRSLLGQWALGLIFGGISGNLLDRLFRDHVVDFLYFYMHRRGGDDAGFAAFNIADSGICIGVALLFIVSWKADSGKKPAEVPSS